MKSRGHSPCDTDIVGPTVGKNHLPIILLGSGFSPGFHDVNVASLSILSTGQRIYSFSISYFMQKIVVFERREETKMIMKF